MSKKNKKDTGVSIGRTSTTRSKTPRPPVLRPVRFKKKTTYDRKQSKVRKDENND